jgi:hypothetical protein
MAPSGHPSVDRHNTLHTDILVPWLARTGPWESRSLWDVRRIETSSARVKTGDHVFGECLRHDYLLLHRLPGGAVVSERRKIGTATSLHCIELDDCTDKRYVD